MIDHVGEQLAGRGLGLHALQQLIARRAQELDLDEGKALVERVDDRLLALGDVGRVEDELAFLARRLDQLRAGRTARCAGPRAARPARARGARERMRRGATGSLPVPVGLVPLFDPFHVQRLELLEVRHPHLRDLRVEALRIAAAAFFSEVRLPMLLDLNRSAPPPRGTSRGSSRAAFGFCAVFGMPAANGDDRHALGREEDLDRRAVALLGIDDVVEQRRDRRPRRAPARRRAARRRETASAWSPPASPSSPRPAPAARTSMRVQVVPPDGAITWPICSLPYSGLVRSIQDFGGFFTSSRVVGDRPAERDARPQLRRDQRLREIVGGVRRRVVLEQVARSSFISAAVGVQSIRSAAQLAGRGFGLHARDQLPARRAHHLDLDEREASCGIR